ncbi:MAG: enoyl-CoA hydratase/isomerase family protein [Trebonia sp.]
MSNALAELAGRLELDLLPGGRPARPLVVLPLDGWRDAPPELIRRAGDLVAAALPVTVGVLAGPPSASLEPLVRAATLTLAAGTVAGAGASTPADARASERMPVDARVSERMPADARASERMPADARLPAATPAGGGPRAIVWTGDLPGAPDLEQAIGRLRTAVERSPRAAIACGQLVRQTAVLDVPGGLAAEAAAYSLLLGGPEFARGLGERGESRHREPSAEPVRVSRDGGRLSIVLDDPARRNAFSAPLREALLGALLVGELDQTIESIELSGAGPAFCSGGDLDEFGTAKDLVAAYLVRLSRAPWRVIARIAGKVTVRAHGACVGAGTEMAAYAGRVVAAPDAFFALPEVGMGLVPGAGGSVSVPRRIGRWRTAWLALTGDRLPAATALRWGLVDEITPTSLNPPSQ